MSTASDRPATGTHCHECGYTSVNALRQRCPSCGARRSQPVGSPLPPPLPGAQVTDDPPFLRRRIVVGGAALLAIAGVVVFVAADDDGGSSSRGATIPEALEESWTEEFAGSGSAAFVGPQVVVVATDGDVTVSADGRSDGDEQWSVVLDDAVSGAVVPTDSLIVQWYDDEIATHLSRLSPNDGAVEWEVDLGDARPVLVGGVLYSAKRAEDGSDTIRELRIVDIRDGTLGASVVADRELFLVGADLVGHDTESITVYDPISFAPRGDPIAVDDDVVAVALWGDLIVTAEGDELTAIDRAGEMVWKVDSPVDTVEALTTAGDLLVVGGEDGLAVVRRIVTGIEDVWQEDATLVQTIAEFDLVVARDGRTLRLLQETTGEQVIAVEDASAEGLQVFANGVLVQRDVVAAYLLPSGTQLWELSTYPEITGGGMVTVVDDDGTFTVTAYR